MNKLLTLTFLLCFSLLYSQKKELRTAEKFFNQGIKIDEISRNRSIKDSVKVALSKETLNANKDLIVNSNDSKLITRYHFLVAKIARNEEEFSKAYENLKLAEGNKLFKNEIKLETDFLTYEIDQYARELSNANEFLKAADLFDLLYKILPDKTELLYQAAGLNINAGKDYYEKALEYYLVLKELKFTGVRTLYFAKDVKTGDEKPVSEFEYSLFEKSKDYILRKEETESLYPTIIKNISYIYIDLGMNDKAKVAIKEARVENPTDVQLILSEAQIYYKLGDNEKYFELINEALEIEPNNPTLYYNLGVISGIAEKREDAEKYYKRALELDPNMENALVNLVSLKVQDEVAEIVKIQNDLPMTKAGDRQYKELQSKKDSIYLNAIPLLRKIIEINPKNISSIKTLNQIYKITANKEGADETQALLNELESK